MLVLMPEVQSRWTFCYTAMLTVVTCITPNPTTTLDMCVAFDVFFVLCCGEFQTKIQLFEILRSLEAVPGVQIETGAEIKTPATLRMPDEDEEMADADQRASGRNLSKRVAGTCSVLFCGLVWQSRYTAPQGHSWRYPACFAFAHDFSCLDLDTPLMAGEGRREHPSEQVGNNYPVRVSAKQELKASGWSAERS